MRKLKTFCICCMVDINCGPIGVKYNNNEGLGVWCGERGMRTSFDENMGAHGTFDILGEQRQPNGYPYRGKFGEVEIMNGWSI